MIRRTLFFLLFLFLCTTHAAFSQWSSGRPDGHAPISVMGDHTHGQGEIMFSYRYMYMNMDGNRDQTHTLTNEEVLQNYMVTPVEMPMQMHMLGVMYGVSDRITVMGMLPYLQSEMEHLARNGNTFTTESSGVGDLSLTALIKLATWGNQRVHAHAGISVPTGSIEEMDVTPASAPQETILPYPMQIGSGTYDLLPGLTYLGQYGDLSWGSQAKGTIRTGDNDNGYRLGNQFMANGWLGLRTTEWFAPTLKMELNTWGNINGADERLNPGMVHTADPDLKAGTRVDVGVGANFFVPNGPFHDVRFAVDANLPFYQHVDGPQMETDWILTFGIQYTM